MPRKTNITSGNKPRGRPRTVTGNRERGETLPTRPIRAKPHPPGQASPHPPGQAALLGPNTQSQDPPGIYSSPSDYNSLWHHFENTEAGFQATEISGPSQDMSYPTLRGTWGVTKSYQERAPNPASSYVNSEFDTAPAAPWPPSGQNINTDTGFASPVSALTASTSTAFTSTTSASPRRRRRRRIFEILINPTLETIQPFSILGTGDVWTTFPRILLSNDRVECYIYEDLVLRLGLCYAPYHVRKVATRFGLWEAKGVLRAWVVKEPNTQHLPFMVTFAVLPGAPPAGGVPFTLGALELRAAYDGQWDRNWPAHQYPPGTGRGDADTLSGNEVTGTMQTHTYEETAWLQ